MGQAFDGANSAAIRMQGRHQTAVYKLAVEFDGASAAFAFPAAFLGAGETQVLTKHVEGSGHRISVKIRRLFVYDAADADFAGTGAFRHAAAPAFPSGLPESPERE